MSGFAAALLFIAGMTSASAASIRLPDGPSVNLVYSKCQTCHDLQYLVDGKGLLPAQWKAVVASMKDYGMVLSDEEQKRIVQYLSAYLGPNAPPQAASPAQRQAGAAADGRELFAENCASCHGPQGRGQPGYFPPLAGNPDLSRDALFPVRVVLHGLSGPIEVNGKAYNGSMPGFGHLSDAEISAVVNFVRSAWGNQPQSEPVSAAQVAKSRGQEMTPAEVHALRDRLR